MTASSILPGQHFTQALEFRHAEAQFALLLIVAVTAAFAALAVGIDQPAAKPVLRSKALD